MPTYIAVVNQDPGSAFGIHFPDVPGCFSAADDLADLPRLAQEALSLHLEGETLPAARSLAGAPPTIAARNSQRRARTRHMCLVLPAGVPVCILVPLHHTSCAQSIALVRQSTGSSAPHCPSG